jgi:hypothetical protein
LIEIQTLPEKIKALKEVKDLDSVKHTTIAHGWLLAEVCCVVYTGEAKLLFNAHLYIVCSPKDGVLLTCERVRIDDDLYKYAMGQVHNYIGRDSCFFHVPGQHKRLARCAEVSSTVFKF